MSSPSFRASCFCATRLKLHARVWSNDRPQLSVRSGGQCQTRVDIQPLQRHRMSPSPLGELPTGRALAQPLEGPADPPQSASVSACLALLSAASEMTSIHHRGLKAFLGCGSHNSSRLGRGSDEEAVVSRLKSLVSTLQDVLTAVDTPPTSQRSAFPSCPTDAQIPPASKAGGVWTPCPPPAPQAASGTAVEAAPSASAPDIPAASPAAAEGPCAATAVMTSPELIPTILSYLMCPAGRDRASAERSQRVMSSLRLVCRRWRDALLWDEFWRPIAQGLLPVLQEDVAAVHRRGGYRSYLFDYGRCLVEQQVRMGESWEEGLELGFEVYDAWDGLCLMSASGPLKVIVDQGHGLTSLRLGGLTRKEVRGPAFSVRSRGSTGESDVETMEDFFERAHEDVLPSHMRVRVTVTEIKTGKIALLWCSDKSTQYKTDEPIEYWQEYLNEGSFHVGSGWVRISSPNYSGDCLTADTTFYIEPLVGQEGVHSRDMLYRMAGGDVDRYGEHKSPMAMLFNTEDSQDIERLIRSLLH